MLGERLHGPTPSFRRVLTILAAIAFLSPVKSSRTEASTQPTRKAPTLSQGGLLSRFANQNRVEGAIQVQDLQRNEAQQAAQRSAAAVSATAAPSTQANKDWNMRPQDETVIVIDSGTGPTANWVIGANDYGIGVPIGTGVYTKDGVNYFPPFPLLFARLSPAPGDFFTEPPVGTGDPSLAKDNKSGNLYMASLAFSSSFCENGVFVYRSSDGGKSWSRPIVPPFAPPQGVGIVTYWEDALDCTIFHDKEWIAVDNTGGEHQGRVYVTWTRFKFTPAGSYVESPIVMAWSDDLGLTFTDPIVVSGSSTALCPNAISGPPGACDVDQFSVPVVLPDGKVAIAFENFQGKGFAQGRGQYLVTVFDPEPNQTGGQPSDGGTLAGPYFVADLFDGDNDYPLNSDGRQTLCNSNFRVIGAGNLAVGKSGILYVSYSDNQKHKGEFPFPTFVGNRASGYACPAGKRTDTDVYVLRSVDEGKTWTEVSLTGTKAANDQWFPWVAADDNGNVSVAFFDRSYNAANKLADTTLVQWKLGSGTSKSTKVSEFASNFDNAFFGIGAFIGDYNGNVIDAAGYSHPVWTGVTPGKNDSDVYTIAVAP
jgi:hypothetical protein